MAVDQDKLMAFLGTFVGDLGATMAAGSVVAGDRLGLYRALAGSGGLLPAELAAATDTSERYVREWLNTQAAGGYIDFDPQTNRYALSPEQALLLADESSELSDIESATAFATAAGASLGHPPPVVGLISTVLQDAAFVLQRPAVEAVPDKMPHPCFAFDRVDSPGEAAVDRPHPVGKTPPRQANDEVVVVLHQRPSQSAPAVLE